MVVIGLDAGTSSVKASLLDVESGGCLASAQYPSDEMAVHAARPGWAEQDPVDWWQATVAAIRAACAEGNVAPDQVAAIGIAYQMHGLVCLDEAGGVLRPSIIWCDSRAVEYGERAYETVGPAWCLEHLLNSPANFTASKFAWVRENEPDVYQRVATILLPGDYLAYRMTGRACTTVSGLSEGILWNFPDHEPARPLMDAVGITDDMLAERVPTFGPQGELNGAAAEAFGLRAGIPVTYRAGDQPNNALSLNVMNHGEVAATAGTSGVIYGVSDRIQFDPESRISSFAHVNHEADATRLGVLTCVNGAGILNAWLRRMLGGSASYPDMNDLAAAAPVGSEGLVMLPFGNGAERVLGNRNVGAALFGLDLNRHGPGHLCRAAQEGIVFGLRFGMDILRSIAVDIDIIRAGHANMFLSPVFRETLAACTGARIELYDTDGSLGAARGAALGAGLYDSPGAAFASLAQVDEVVPDPALADGCAAAYEQWRRRLDGLLQGVVGC